MGDATGPYGANVLQRLAFSAQRIQQAADLLASYGFNVSVSALAGAVAEELHDSLSSTWWERLGDWAFDISARIGAPLLPGALEADYQIYDQNRTFFDDPTLTPLQRLREKLEHPVLRDLGDEISG